MRPLEALAAIGFLTLVLLPGATAEGPSVSPVRGLAGYWPCDEGQGGRAANLVGRNANLFGSTGDAVGQGIAWADGRFGAAVHFDRGGRGLTVQPMRELECSCVVTVAAWVKLDATPSAGLILSRERGYRLALDTAAQRRVRFQLALDGDWAGNWLLSRTALQPGRWYHVAGVYDGSERRIYLDGQLDARAPATGAISLGDDTTIGRDLAGTVDEVRVWSRALSQDEVALAMGQDADQVKAALQPPYALRLYPVRCVGMTDRELTAEAAVFNSAPVPFLGDASVELLSPEGKPIAQDSSQLSVPARETVRIRLQCSPKTPGMYALVIRTGGGELFRMPVYVMAPRPRQDPGPLKLAPVASVDLTQDLGPDKLCEDGSSRVVDSPLGRYREAGSQRGSRFVVRLTLRRPGLHLVRVRYPDDKPRTCEVAATSPDESDTYNLQSGYLTGVAYPLSNQLQTLECVLWARDVRQAILFTTWETGKPAAAASVEAYEVSGSLPASPAATENGPRQIGLYWEDAAPLPWCVGAEGTGFAAFDHAVGNLCDLMDYTGENALFHPAVWYGGTIYNSLVEESGTLGGRDMPPAGWIDILLQRFEERGFKFYPTLNVHQLPSLMATGNADIQRIKAGEPTFNAVTRDGTATSRTWHNRPPAYNALHPEVKRRVLALVQEMADRFGGSPAFGGVAFHLTRCQLLQLGGLDVGYDDWSVAKFEQDTGVKVPVDARDPDRFGKRCDWLLANEREKWVAWRCNEVAQYYGQAARILTDTRPDLKLACVLLHPLPAVHADLRRRWEQGERLADLTREAGLDPALIARQPGTVVIKHLGPSDYRFALAGAPPGSEQALLSVRGMDLCDDQLRDYRATPDFGVFLYNRYFESAANRQRPLACDWYRDPGWLASAVVPAGDHFVEYYARSVAALDPALIVTGGFTVGTTGHEPQLEPFARVFRALPVGAWEDIPGLGDQVAGRTLEAGGRRFVYVVNRSPAQVQVHLPQSVATGEMQPVGGSPAPTAAEGGSSVTLRPYQLAAWASDLRRP